MFSSGDDARLLNEDFLYGCEDRTLRRNVGLGYAELCAVRGGENSGFGVPL